MTLTEKVKADMGGVVFKIFEVAALSGGSTDTSLSLGAVQMNEVIHANFTWSARIMTGDATAWPVLLTPTTSGGIDMVLSGSVASSAPDSGILEVWGH